MNTVIPTSESYKGFVIFFNNVTGSALVYKNGAFVKPFCSDCDKTGKGLDNAPAKAKQFINDLNA